MAILQKVPIDAAKARTDGVEKHQDGWYKTYAIGNDGRLIVREKLSSHEVARLGLA